MFKAKLLRITFDLNLLFDELAAFRGAVAHRAGPEHHLFHNHIDDTRLRYSYPLIQYKLLSRKASIICIQDGVEEIDAFFFKSDLRISLNGKIIDLKIENLKAYQATLNVYDSVFRYNISNWLALNEKNYRLYKALKDSDEQVQFLERILTGNLISMAKGLGYQVEKEITVSIVKIKNLFTRTYKETKFQVFHADFDTNFFLPDYIGLGKNASIGYGVVRRVRSIKCVESE
jgi:hypothetical protein